MYKGSGFILLNVLRGGGTLGGTLDEERAGQPIMMFLLVECPDTPSVAFDASLRGESAESGLIIGGSTASLSTCEVATCGTEAGSFIGEGITFASELGGISGKTTIFPVSFIESSSVASLLVCAFAGEVDNLGLYAI